MKDELPPTDVDALAAHLDRAWDLLERGDLEGAQRSAEKALELDDTLSEAFTILGNVAAAAGELDEALELYAKATNADPEDVDPILRAAEIESDLERHDKALHMVDTALDLAEDEEDWLDATLLKAEILIRLERPEDASKTLAELPPDQFPDPRFHLAAGKLFFDLENVEQSQAHLNQALELDPDYADAHHGLGLVYEITGNRDAMVKSWLKTLELDTKGELGPFTMDKKQFQQVAQSAFDELPEEIQTLLEDVPILLEERPTPDQVKDGVDPRLLGLFQGVPYGDKPNVGGGEPSLDAIHLFQRNIERYATDDEDAENQTRITLFHETAHFFGMDDDDLDEVGLG